MRILIVEDDQLISESLEQRFSDLGHGVDCAYDGETAHSLVSHTQYDLVILDLNLPKRSGEEITKRIRQRSNTPILILTARQDVCDRINLLDLGADDFLSKPFDFGELEARCRSIVRRSRGNDHNVIELGNLSFDSVTATVKVNGESIQLKQREYRLLEVFINHPNRVLSKEDIIDHLYGYDNPPNQNAIETYVGRLRKALVTSNVEIKTLRGLGYVFAVQS
ncbi:response regulator transcription factor [Vibrio gazogenes]|uniref:Two-component system, OmpR family, response regulator TctD n=1 Tax=Vibrio gazogenes DSM 21264 = NBRC 103151 TaxID=1123492 RepID=A0A1M4U2N4_VIBGA|nr:response regulator transcription factor [Vibrio gazogenes]USP16221.1 response regulator transcription factor [Vibrio gazogenes]SHE50886.1 two-component system, OmpR family, response regulator TctD [Vibrio gazogenes DSM 21264] [Vibrio gazogenes DSM 21264 = NBRC 103151]SJN53143.1 Transcriptional regulatory protein tctD [Vibrio gazogenes]